MQIPEQYFLYISIFIGLIYVAMMFIGYKHGFLYELVNLLYTAASLALAYFASPVLASLFPIIDLSKTPGQYYALNELFNLNKIINTVAYFIIVFLLLKVLYIFISLFVKSLNKIPVIGKFNQFLGLVFGVLNATLIVLALSMLLSLPLIKNGKEIRDKTILRYITKYSDQALTFLVAKAGEQNLKDTITGFDIDSYREDFKNWIISITKTNE